MNFLVIPDFPREAELFNTLYDNFQRQLFGTDSTLVVICESGKDIVKYGYKWLVRIGGESTKTRFFIRKGINLKQMMSEVDYYILLSEQSSDEYVELAYEARKKIMPLDVVLGQWCNVARSREVLEMHSTLKKMIDEQIVAQYSTDDYIYVIDRVAWGESIILFYYAKSISDYYNKKIIVINYRENKRNFWLRCPYVASVVDADPIVIDYLAVNYHVTDLIQVHFMEEVTKFIDCVDMNYGMVEEFRDYFKLPKDAVFKKYDHNLLPENIENAQNVFSKLNLKRGKTVFLSPNGDSFRLLDSNRDFFENLVIKLRENGYEVVTNSTDEIINGVKNVFLNLEECVHFIGLCGNVISVETGFVEAVCALNTSDSINLNILWPHPWDPALRRFLAGWVINCLPLIKVFGSDFIPGLIQKHRVFTDRLWDENIKVHDVRLNENANDDKINELLSNLKQ